MHLAGPDPTALLVQRNGWLELVGHIEDGPPAERSGLLDRHLEQCTADSPLACLGTHEKASHHTQLVDRARQGFGGDGHGGWDGPPVEGHVADDLALGFRHPRRQGVGSGQERPQIGGQVRRIAIPFMNDFRQPDA